MNKLKTLIATLVLLFTSFTANAIVETEPSWWGEHTMVVSYNSNYTVGYYIGVCNQWLTSCVIAPPHYTLPQWVNDDIYFSMNYAIQNGIQFRWGQCISNGSVPPCLQ